VHFVFLALRVVSYVLFTTLLGKDKIQIFEHGILLAIMIQIISGRRGVIYDVVCTLVHCPVITTPQVTTTGVTVYLYTMP